MHCATRWCRLSATLSAVLLAGIAHAASPLGTQFTYQGRLLSAGSPANGDMDFEFTLWDEPAGGSQIGPAVAAASVPIGDGLFTVEIDFGANVFAGDARWLEISVRPSGSGDPFALLAPRQPLTAAPYALYALGAGGGFWDPVGNHIFNNNTGNVGIATPFPLFPLHATGSGNRTIYGRNTGNGAGVYGSVDGPGGIGVRAVAAGATGNGIGVHAFSNSPDGHAGFFVGRSYFSQSVGINQTNPLTGLHVVGQSLSLDTPALLNENLILEDEDAVAGIYSGGGGTFGSAVTLGEIDRSDGRLVDKWTMYRQTATMGPKLKFAYGNNASYAVNQMIVTMDPVNRFVGVNRESRVSSTEHFGVFAPVTSGQGGMYILTEGRSTQPYYGYSAGGTLARTFLDGADADKWKVDNGGVHLTVTRDGNVGVGTTTPGARLTVNNSGGTIGLIADSAGPASAAWINMNNPTGANAMLVTTNSNNGAGILLANTGGGGALHVSAGTVGIGASPSTIPAGVLLGVGGKVMCEELEIQLQADWPDYVFEKDYQLMPLEELEASIREHKHLPGIPSAAEVEEKGIAVGQMQADLLRKVEELTLYMIDMNKEVQSLKQENASLREQVALLKDGVN